MKNKKERGEKVKEKKSEESREKSGEKGEKEKGKKSIERMMRLHYQGQIINKNRNIIFI